MAETRQEIHAEARKLVRAGISRRRMDTILRGKFGTSIGKATFSKFYRERVGAIEQTMEARAPTGYRKPRTRRARIYTQLVQSNFLPWEARELSSRLRGTKTIHELKVMAAERGRLRNRFLRYAARAGIPARELRRAWEGYVRKWYGDTAIRWQKQWERDQIKKGKQILKRRTKEDLLWKWFGHTRKDLPPDLQYETPRKAQRPRQRFITADQITRDAQINNLRRMIREAETPREAAQYRQWLSELEGK